MNRFASIATTAALAGTLIGATAAANAQSNLYMVPLSDLSLTYNPGDTVQFAAVVDLNNAGFASLSIPFAATFTDAQFGEAAGGVDSIDNGSAPFVSGQPTQKDPNNTRQVVFASNAQSYTTTASTYLGSTVYTVQNTVGQVADKKGTTTVAFPAGTYTLGTFSFPISSKNNTGAATIFLPTPAGYTNSANSADGAYAVGTGALNQILGKNPAGGNVAEPILFPNTGGKFSSLTFKVKTTGGGGATPAPSSLLVIAMGAIPAVGLLRRRSAK